MLGCENWDDNFDTLLHLVKVFVIAVWEVKKLYGDDPIPRSTSASVLSVYDMYMLVSSEL